MNGHQIRVGEIAVVVGFFFRTHRDGAGFGLVPVAGLLKNTPAGFEHADVAFYFILEGFLEIAEGVEVFYFDLGTEFFCAEQADADIGVTAERAFFHVAVADAGVEHDLAKRGEIGVGLVWSAHVRLGDDFAEGRAAAVVVDVGLSGGLRKPFVQIFCGVFFEMQASDADAFFRAVVVDFNPAVGGERKFVLRDLIAFGQIGIEIIFAGKARVLMDAAMQCQRGAHG